MDRILLEGLACQAHIGVPDAERAARQPLWLDIELETDLAPAAAAEDPNAAVDYAKAYELVLKLAEEKPRKLIETLAGEAADLMLYAFPAVRSATVRVWKKPAGMGGAKRVGAEVVRRR